MFRRRRASTEGPPADGLPDAVPGEEVPAAAEPATAGPAPAGPWDAGDDVPDQDRIDFGSLRVPLGDEFEIRLPDEIMAELAGEQAEPEEGRWPLNPFERGPEITETR